ncbi:GyrI-like domain-containing protein [Mucilaginibacter sp. OK098]|uniref:GyrI-like domain-containing protein n=1 Tax=Mucilaginibacter sp. OK098 TaxID=1855297 RepID=UPI00090F34FF|nr:GyrI-like domain-containing protein [Mucilaginibacter sp. OK098]SHM96831.1 hypothetical protein SAMN05216524_104336 [Mucilaginibacter sp. OK098]
MKKIDFKKELQDLYKVSASKIEVVTAPQLNYLMIDGCGDPNSSQLFQNAVEALFSLSYTIKFMLKKGIQQIDYGVMPLEGLWFSDNINNFSMENKAAWKWTLMIMQPKFVTASIVSMAVEQASKKKDMPMLNDISFGTMDEGLCAQVLHSGPYNNEPATIARLHAFIKDNDYSFNGNHREIYLNDMRRTAPEKLRTIIRQPIIKL